MPMRNSHTPCLPPAALRPDALRHIRFGGVATEAGVLASRQYMPVFARHADADGYCTAGLLERDQLAPDDHWKVTWGAGSPLPAQSLDTTDHGQARLRALGLALAACPANDELLRTAAVLHVDVAHAGCLLQGCGREPHGLLSAMGTYGAGLYDWLADAYRNLGCPLGDLPRNGGSEGPGLYEALETLYEAQPPATLYLLEVFSVAGSEPVRRLSAADAAQAAGLFVDEFVQRMLKAPLTPAYNVLLWAFAAGGGRTAACTAWRRPGPHPEPAPGDLSDLNEDLAGVFLNEAWPGLGVRTRLDTLLTPGNGEAALRHARTLPDGARGGTRPAP